MRFPRQLLEMVRPRKEFHRLDYKSFLVAESFSDGIIISVNHIGDSDSTGSSTWQILGANLGIQAIGMEWLNDLELRDELNMLAHDFYSISNLHQGAQMPLSFREKYPPN